VTALSVAGLRMTGRAVAVGLAAVLALSAAGLGTCSTGAANASCPMARPDLRRLAPLPSDITVADEEQFGPEACGLDGFTNRLLTTPAGDSGALLARLTAVLKADGWAFKGGYEPIVVAHSLKRGLEVNMLVGAEEARHDWLLMNDGMSHLLTELLAAGTPVVLFRVDRSDGLSD
jgi:hypothetical protein